ncbi:MAG TPA: DUF3226 domain-containing protein [Candidatus Acidoferrum sp.]|nr:DUF3226 domain-containing protein [Candidatus Acidoferrum sp.]
MAISLSQPRILICEGSSDVSFFSHLIKKRNLPEFDIFQPNVAEGVPSGKGGYKGFLEGLSTILPSKAVKGILIVGDNDLNPANSFQNIQDQITAAGGYGVPAEPLQLARSNTLPPVVVMMLPWAGVEGVLESLCLEALLGYRPHLKECVDHFSECTQTMEWEPTIRAKMQLHALVSALCKSEPATALTHVWSKKETIVPLDQPAFDQLANFLSRFDEFVTREV